MDCFPADTESLEVGGENIISRIEGFGEVCMSAPTSDWNTACGTRSGFYMGADMSNSPNGSTVAGWWWVIHLAHNNLYQRQIAFSFLNNAQMFTRIMNNGTWNDWTLVNQPMVTADSNAVLSGRYVDGKPEYVKRITTSIAPNTSKLVATGLTAGTHEITETHEITDYKGYITNRAGTGIKVKDGYTWSTTSNDSFMIHVANGTDIRVFTGQDASWISNDHICILEIYYIDIS